MQNHIKNPLLNSICALVTLVLFSQTILAEGSGNLILDQVMQGRSAQKTYGIDVLAADVPAIESSREFLGIEAEVETGADSMMDNVLPEDVSTGIESTSGTGGWSFQSDIGAFNTTLKSMLHLAYAYGSGTCDHSTQQFAKNASVVRAAMQLQIDFTKITDEQVAGAKLNEKEKLCFEVLVQVAAHLKSN